MKNRMQIRKASADEMLRLWGYADESSASPTATFFSRHIRAGQADFWTIDAGCDLIGELYAFYDLSDKDFADGKDVAYLCAFRVKREYRGQGLGSRLMQTVLSDLKVRGYRYATIGVGTDESQNIRLYRRFGFDVKVKECYDDPCAMDALMRPVREPKAWWLLAKPL